MSNETLLSAFRRVLRPLVRVLLRNGVTWDEFAQLGKEVFVEIARSDYGIQGRPTNTARVALMTGLSRREVARVKSLPATPARDESAAPNKISQILTAWHVDADFLAADGRPAVLAANGDGPSIATLLKRHAGDMPHGAILKELKQLRLVEETRAGFRVTSRDYIRSAADPDLMRQAATALHDHATTIAHNVDAKRSEPARFERMATNNALSRRHIHAFHAYVAGEGQAFLERIDAWLAAHASAAGAGGHGNRAARDRPVRTGVGLYLIHDEEQGEGRYARRNS